MVAIIFLFYFFLIDFNWNLLVKIHSNSSQRAETPALVPQISLPPFNSGWAKVPLHKVGVITFIYIALGEPQ